MLEVTETAGQKLKAYLEENKIESAVRVDFVEGSGCGCSSGFSVTSSIPLPSAGGGCGGSCSSGSCGSC